MLRHPLPTLLSSACLAALLPHAALAADPIKIGVIAEAQAVAGSSIAPAAQLAADEINAKGGVNGRKIEVVVYDNHSSAAESVRAFQRAVNEDKVNAVIASYISEVVLALEPWASRLKTPFVTPGAASNEISKSVHAASSLTITADFIFMPSTRRSLPASQTRPASAVEVR